MCICIDVYFHKISCLFPFLSSYRQVPSFEFSQLNHIWSLLGILKIFFLTPLKDAYMLCLIHKLKSLTLQILPHGFGSAWAVASIHPRQIDLGFLPQIQTDLEFCRTPEVMNPLQCAQITLAPSHSLISPLFLCPNTHRQARQNSLNGQTGCQPAMTLLS